MSLNDQAVKPVLVIGCGNELRADDAAGRVAVDLIAGKFPHCRTLSVIQLLPEHAEIIARAGVVVLIDAAIDRWPGEVTCDLFAPAGPEQDSHGIGLSQILSLCREIFGPAPPVYCIRIGAENFVPGEPLSPAVRDAMPKVMECFRNVVLAS